MDVDHRNIAEHVPERVAEDPVDPPEHGELDVRAHKTPGHELLRGIAAAVRGGRERLGRDAGGLRAFEGGRALAARADVDDARVELTLLTCVQDRLEVRAATAH